MNFLRKKKEDCAIYDTSIITYKEAAFKLGITYGTLRVYISRGILKPVRPNGRRPYFKREYIDEIILNGYTNRPP